MTSDGLIRKGSESCRGSKSGKHFCTVVNRRLALAVPLVPVLVSIPFFVVKEMAWERGYFPSIPGSSPVVPLKFIRGCDTAENSTKGTEKGKTSSPPFFHPTPSPARIFWALKLLTFEKVLTPDYTFSFPIILPANYLTEAFKNTSKRSC